MVSRGFQDVDERKDDMYTVDSQKVGDDLHPIQYKQSETVQERLNSGKEIHHTTQIMTLRAL